MTMDEGCDEREGILESLENTGNDGEHVQHCCFLEDELAKAKEVARESELKCQELTAAEHSRIYNLVNGSAPVKIPTGFQNQHRTNATSSKTILKRSDKPCFAEAKARGSCTRGSTFSTVVSREILSFTKQSSLRKKWTTFTEHESKRQRQYLTKKNPAILPSSPII